MDEDCQKSKLQLGCNLLAIRIVNDYVKYLSAGGHDNPELESLANYHIAKCCEEPTELFVEKVMDEIIKILRIKGASHNTNK